MLTIDNLISLFATLLSLASSYEMSSKRYYTGFCISLLSMLPWAYLGIKSSLYGLLLWSVVATILNIRGLIKLRNQTP